MVKTNLEYSLDKYLPKIGMNIQKRELENYSFNFNEFGDSMIIRRLSNVKNGFGILHEIGIRVFQNEDNYRKSENLEIIYEPEFLLRDRKTNYSFCEEIIRFYKEGRRLIGAYSDNDEEYLVRNYAEEIKLDENEETIINQTKKIEKILHRKKPNKRNYCQLMKLITKLVEKPE